MLVFFFLTVFTMFCISTSFAEPIVEEVHCNPYEPAPLSTVTFTAGIYNNSSRIDEVRLIAQECMDDICFIDSQNISLNYTYSCCKDFYEAKLKLTHENATQIKYHLLILNNGTWHKYKTEYISLKIKPDENPVDSKENTTPGFEILTVLASIILFVVKKSFRKSRNDI